MSLTLPRKRITRHFVHVYRPIHRPRSHHKLQWCRWFLSSTPITLLSRPRVASSLSRGRGCEFVRATDSHLAKPPRSPSDRGTLQDAPSPMRGGAPLGLRQGWLFRQGFASERKTRPMTARAAPPCSGLSPFRNLRVDLALARREPRWRPSAPQLPPAIVLLPPAPHHAELGAPWLPHNPLHNARLPGSSSGFPMFPEPRLPGFHLGLRKPPPRATLAPPGPCLSPAPPAAARPPPHVTRPRRGFR